MLLFLAIAILLILGALSLGSYIAWFYPLELFAHARFQYLIICLIVTGILALLWQRRQIKSKVLILFALLLVGLNAVEILPWYLPHSQQISSGSSKQIRVVSLNLNVKNDRFSEVIEVVRLEKPDIALFIEVNRDGVDKLKAGLTDILPNNYRSPGGGLALLTSLPILNARADNFKGAGNHNLLATLEIDKKPVEFIGTHPFVPVKRWTFHRRNSQLAALGDYIQGIKDPVIVAGDFNLTPWSPYYRRFINKVKLHNTRYGYGVLPSWPRSATHVHLPSWLLPLVNIPIDHCFVSKDFRVAGVHIGENANSDHAPLVSDLVLR